MKALSVTGRILFSLLYIYAGLNHFINASTLASGVPSFVQGGIIWVYITGMIMLAGGILLIINMYVRAGAIMIALLMLVFVFTVHVPGIFNPEQRNFALGFAFNNLALAG